MKDFSSKFIDQMRSQGLDAPGEIVANGEFHRFGPKKSQWYVLNADGMAAFGAFGDWRTGEVWHFKSSAGRTWSLGRKREHDDQVERLKAQAEARVEAARASARALAKHAFDLAETSGRTAYMERKKIADLYGARIDQAGNLLVPMTDETGELHGCQTIYSDGSKYFLSGQRTSGTFHIIGEAKNDVAYLCEGFATAATIREATGKTAVVAFNAGNLVHVAEALSKAWPETKLTIAADNDWQKPTNAGLMFAARASKFCAGRIVSPKFGPGDEGLSDFNDVHLRDGIEKVRECFSDQSATPMVSVDAVISEPFVHSKTINNQLVPICTIENVAELLDRLCVNVRYNVVKKELEIIIPGQSFISDKAQTAAMFWLQSIATRAKIPLEKFDGYVAFCAYENPYNPVVNWIESRPWDGTSRLSDFYATVRAVGEDVEANRLFKETLIKRWMLSAVAAIRRPDGVSAHGVLVFQGPQYVGKTAWFKRLVPADLNVVADGLTLDVRDKDSIFNVVSNWLVELGELDATFRRSDIAALKSFITRNHDKLRRPYDKTESSFPRRTVFFGSVNEENFLHDPTGNRRYWTIRVEDIDHKHGLDMQQVWAEFDVMLQRGEEFYLTFDEMLQLNQRNAEHEVIEPIAEMIQRSFDWEAPHLAWKMLTATQVVIELGIKNPSQRDVRSAAKAIKDITGKGALRLAAGRCFMMPPVKRSVIRQF